jgi:ParB/RepB/Spo0J family partition protein
LTSQTEEVKLIPLQEIVPLPTNVTVMGREEDLMLRTDMTRIESKGLYKIDPILVRRLSPEEIAEIKAKQPWSQAQYMIVDGHRRFYAARELGWSQIRARIVDATLEEALAMNYMKNKARGTVDPLREAMYFKHLYEDLKLTEEKIAERFGIDRSYVSRILKRIGITPEVRRYIVTRVTWEKPISGKHLEVIASAPEEKQTELAKAIVEGKLSYREAELVGKALEKGMPTEKAVSVVKAVKKVAKPKEAEKVIHHVAAKPEFAEEITKLPEERLKAKVEEIVKPPPPTPKPAELAFKRAMELKNYYPAIMVGYIYERYKDAHFQDVLKAATWLLWSKLSEQEREALTSEAIRLGGKGFEEPISG